MDVTDVLGDFGPVQKRVFAVCIVRSIALVSIMYTVQFTSGDVDHWCAPPVHHSLSNLTTSEWQHCCIPQDSRGYSRCQRYQVADDMVIFNSSAVDCSHWEYAGEFRDSSFVPEWNLVCDQRWQVSLFYTLFSTGSLLSYGPSGYFADKFGRRPAILVGVLVVTLTTVSTALSSSVVMFTVSRFLAGVGYSFVQHVVLTLYIELSGKKQRSFVQIIFNGFWGMGLMIQACISILVPDWRLFILISTLPFELIFMVSWFRFLPESPRWLLSSKKYVRAERNLSKLAEINGIAMVNKASIMEGLKQKVERNSSEENCTVGGFFKSKRLLTISAILFFSNAAKSFIGSGLNISLRHFGGIVQINYLVHGFSAVLSVGAYEVVKSFHKPRRISLICCYVITGLGFITTLFVGDDLQWLRLVLVMTGNVLKKVASASLYIIASEVFPTHLRGKGMGAFMLAGRVGSVFASFTDLLGYKYGRDASMILFGVICFVICFVILFLPDTDDQILPDSLAEAKLITEKKPTKTTKPLLEIAIIKKFADPKSKNLLS